LLARTEVQILSSRPLSPKTPDIKGPFFGSGPFFLNRYKELEGPEIGFNYIKAFNGENAVKKGFQ
jgi:hypothetical protein